MPSLVQFLKLNSGVVSFDDKTTIRNNWTQIWIVETKDIFFFLDIFIQISRVGKYIFNLYRLGLKNLKVKYS